MPNKKSAQKALRQDAKKAVRNRNTKDSIAFAIKKTRYAVRDGQKADATKFFTLAQKLLAKAAKKNVIKKNNASRRTSRLANMLKGMK